jgi:hypothetical protein
VTNDNLFFLLTLVGPPDKCLGLDPDLFVKAKEGDSFAQLDIGNDLYS